MRKSCLFFLILLTSSLIKAQSTHLEELPSPVLRQKIKTGTEDTNRVQFQLALGRLLLDNASSGKAQLDSSFMLANQAATLSRKLNYNYGTINSMILAALCWNKKGNYTKGTAVAQEVLTFSEKVNNSFGMGEAYIVMGHAYNISTIPGLKKRMEYNEKAIAVFRKNNVTFRLASLLKDNAELLFLAQRKNEAVNLLFEALNIGKSIGYRRIHSTYWLIGRTSNEMGDFPNAIKYNLLAIKTAKDVNDTTLQLCSIYHTMAVTYSSMGDYKNAIPYSLLALQIARKYNNKDYIATVSMVLATAYTRTNRLDKALMLLTAVQRNSANDLERLAVTNNLLTNLTFAEQFRSADIYAAEVRALLGKISANDYEVFRGSYAALAEYYLHKRQYANARFYNDRYAEIVNSINYAAEIRLTEKRYFELDSLNGNFRSAIVHYMRAQRIKDSTDNITKAYQVSLLLIENETEKKNQHIDTLTKQTLAKDAQLKRNQLIQNAMIAGAVLLLIITTLIYSRYRLKQKTNRKLELSRRQLDQKNIFLEKLTMNQEKLLIEKEWLVKEVHHRVKNNLQMVTSLLYSQSVYLEDASALLAIKDSLRRMQAMSLIHQKLYLDENTTTIDMAGYLSDLVRYLHESFDTDNRITFEQSVEKIDLDVSQAIPLGLIFTESIVNAIKYAFLNGSQGLVSISLQHAGPDHLLLKIADNGIGLPEGFDTNENNSLGLDLMQGLAKQLNGSFHIENDNGVHITVRFPVLKFELPGQQS
ncbi:Two-component sensor histidine kinase, contains HisKA and HATPase domains [Pedobacter westerhofensis]|uniref:histidine kinase n=1 Tax=Pedobacter westerhofensis TaxID=425512 RepID=A0A521FT17_9SPHI|nr:histidine kinase dimerization/phosphoacceptor domain -containing protein [Pedobacter westerhofensis]SMO99367.1 Two-component sensor histidine kinase, contains HisKA and HATPase domains [Pedobacter westerhofensis]